mmetsp:Transcript_18483/g.31876  ORF Transcript_18483/g.31876 Transcript_18483/m.31876 type:complete len:80 (-) Transcript_18483:1004-1243(-)
MISSNRSKQIAAQDAEEEGEEPIEGEEHLVPSGKLVPQLGKVPLMHGLSIPKECTLIKRTTNGSTTAMKDPLVALSEID